MWLRFAYYPTLSEIRMYIFGENTAYWWWRKTRWFCCLFHHIEHFFSDGNISTKQYNCLNNTNVQINCQTAHSYIIIGNIMISWYRTKLLALSEKQSCQDIKQNIFWMIVAGQSVLLTDGLTEKLILVYYHGFIYIKCSKICKSLMLYSSSWPL